MSEYDPTKRCDVEIYGASDKVFCPKHNAWYLGENVPPDCLIATWNPATAFPQPPRANA